jgi:hypothetical protein
VLSIRKEQMPMRLNEESGFIDWYINEFMPEYLPQFHETFNFEDLAKMVAHGRREALKYGFADPESQIHFVTLMWKIGPNFHHFPGFREIANATDQPGPMRIEQFYHVSDEEGADAVLGADDRFWFPESE